MSCIPNFANIAFENTARAAPAGSAEPWMTPEGIPVKPGYSEADLEGIDFLETWPGVAPYLRGPYRSEEHTSELQSLTNLVCRLLLEKKNRMRDESINNTTET